MPIVTFHLAEGACSAAQAQRLLVEASALYAEVLQSPMERVRAFLRTYPREFSAVAGQVVADTGANAPYFEFLVLRGRPVEQRHALLRGFTDLLVDVLDVERELIRGQVIQLDPEDWGIGGEPASTRRQAEIAARAGIS